MKIILLFIVFSSCTFSSVHTNEKANLIESTNKIDCDDIQFDIIVEDSDKSEFHLASENVLFFQGNKTDSIALLTYNSYRRPTEVATQNKRLIFNNISPDYEELQENYFYLGYNPDLEKHLVYVSYYESENYLLIDNITSNIDTLIGRPIFSPDKKKMICYYINPYEPIEIYEQGFYPRGDIEIYSISRDKVKRIFSDSFDFIPIEIRWKDNNTILIKSIHPSEYEYEKDQYSKFDYYKITLITD